MRLAFDNRSPVAMLAASLTITSARVLCRRCGTRGNYMSMHGLAARTSDSSTSFGSRSGHRTQMMARGPGWRLASGQDGTWLIKLIGLAPGDSGSWPSARPNDGQGDDPVATWAHMLRTLRSIAATHGMRAAVIDLRGSSRLAGPAADAAALLFAEFEHRGLKIATVVGTDLIHAARVHRLMSTNATTHGRCFLAEDEAIEWVASSVSPEPPSVPAPLRMLHRRTPGLQPPRV